MKKALLAHLNNSDAFALVKVAVLPTSTKYCSIPAALVDKLIEECADCSCHYARGGSLRALDQVNLQGECGGSDLLQKFASSINFQLEWDHFFAKKNVRLESAQSAAGTRTASPALVGGHASMLSGTALESAVTQHATAALSVRQEEFTLEATAAEFRPTLLVDETETKLILHLQVSMLTVEQLHGLQIKTVSSQKALLLTIPAASSTAEFSAATGARPLHVLTQLGLSDANVDLIQGGSFGAAVDGIVGQQQHPPARTPWGLFGLLSRWITSSVRAADPGALLTSGRLVYSADPHLRARTAMAQQPKYLVVPLKDERVQEVTCWYPPGEHDAGCPVRQGYSLECRCAQLKTLRTYIPLETFHADGCLFLVFNRANTQVTARPGGGLFGFGANFSW